MLPYSLWLAEAEALPPGGSVKLPHPGCSASEAMKVSHTEEGFFAHCFKCGSSGFKPHASIQYIEHLTRKAIIGAQREAAATTYRLPVDFSHTMPTVALTFLLMNNCSEEAMEHYNIGWSEKLQRIIIPIRNSLCAYVGWTGRAVLKGHKPKYLERVLHGNICYAPHYQHPMGNVACYDNNDYVVIVEDALSAYKISEVQTAMSLLGTSCKAELLSRVLKDRTPILWLDPDKAGYSGTAKLQKQASLFTHCAFITSKRDPKHYSRASIREKVKHAIEGDTLNKTEDYAP